jgi:hypothetical protein
MYRMTIFLNSKSSTRRLPISNNRLSDQWSSKVTENPFQPRVDTANANKDEAQGLTTSRAAYNVVTDTVTGVNVRWSDNKFQAVFVFISIIVTASLGALLTAINTQWNLPWYGGALIGSFAGLVIGIFASGIFLMFYRAARHLKGKHD